MHAAILLSLALAATFAAAPSSSWAADEGTISVDGAWARPTIGDAALSSAYVTITNSGDSADALIGVETSFAEQAQLHTMTIDNAIMRMRPIARIEVAPGTIELAPRGDHIMLMNLRERLEEGDRLPLTLIFEEAGEIEVEVKVRGLEQHGGGDQHHR
jgi:periplasmic copper chaperone A